MLKALAGADRSYVTFDDLFERDLAQRDPAGFLQRYRPPVLIDEVQYAPQLFAYIKQAVDKGATPGSFWLAASQTLSSIDALKSMAGRVAVLRMSSLSQREIDGHDDDADFCLTLDAWQRRAQNRQPKTLSAIFSCIWRGALPHALNPTTDRDDFYSTYVSDLITRCVTALLPGIDPCRFLRFMIAAASRTAQTLNLKAMARVAEMDEETAKVWLKALKALGIVFFVDALRHPLLKRTVKKPKLYFEDTGLVAYLTRYPTPEILEVGALNCAVYENFVVTEIMKNIRNRGLNFEFYYWRDFDGKTVDLILEVDGQLFPIVIRKTDKPKLFDVRHFSVLKKAPLSVGSGAVICMSPTVGALNTETLVIPTWAL